YSPDLGIAVEAKTWSVASKSLRELLGVSAAGGPGRQRMATQQSGRYSSLPGGTEQWLVVGIRGQGIREGIPTIADQVRQETRGLFSRIYLITDAGFVPIL